MVYIDLIYPLSIACVELTTYAKKAFIDEHLMVLYNDIYRFNTTPQYRMYVSTNTGECTLILIYGFSNRAHVAVITYFVSKIYIYIFADLV